MEKKVDSSKFENIQEVPRDKDIHTICQEFEAKMKIQMEDEERKSKVAKNEEVEKLKKEAETQEQIKKLKDDIEKSKVSYEEKIKQLNEEKSKLSKNLEEGNLKKFYEERKKKIEEEDKVNQIQKQGMMCNLCMLAITQEEEAIFLNECPDIFHRKCLANYIRDKGETNIKCPICSKLINDKDTKDLMHQESIILNIINKESTNTINEYKKTIEFNYNDISSCPTIGCLNTLICNSIDNDPYFTCPLCKEGYCLKCRTEKHDEHTCTENVENKKIIV